MKSLVIGGTQSGVGKTSIAVALMAALTRRGHKVQPFKVGPDFIDTSFHTLACQNASRNLDGWMLSREYNLNLFNQLSAKADVSIIEGVMGLFDGSGGKTETGSTAEMAKWIGAPVVLVVDASALSRSAAAIVKGFNVFDPDLKIAGVIFNKVAGELHAQWLREAVESSCEVPVLGSIPRDARFEIPERHLGLTMPFEQRKDLISGMADVLEEHLELEKLFAEPAVGDPPAELPRENDKKRKRVRIAIARDKAFCFYYEDNLEQLRHAGAETIEFSPLHEPLPENVDGVYFGGGYPELYAKQLSANTALLETLRDFSQRGGMIYGECGGLMFLSQGIIDKEGHSYPLCGVFPFWTRMVAKCKLSYVEIIPKFEGDQVFVGSVRGHAFHYSEIVGEISSELIYEGTTSSGQAFQEGYAVRNTLASYVHLHFGSNPAFAEFLVHRCLGNHAKVTA